MGSEKGGLSFPELTPAQQMMSSCSGAIATSILVTPLDVVKIRLQAQQKVMNNKCFLYCNGLMDHLCPCINGTNNDVWFRRPSHFNGTIDALVKISRYEGITSLWSGLPPTLIMAVPSTVIYFTTYEQLRKMIFQQFGSATPMYNVWIPMLSGAIARCGSAVVISPLELIRTKMQSKKLKYSEIGTAVRDHYRVRGFFGMWTGLGATIMRDVPFSALYWMNYEFLKIQWNQQEPTFSFSFTAGAFSGTVAALLTLPFDVVKTHRQIELGEKEIYTGTIRRISDKPTKSRSTYAILKNLYQTNGVKSLFSGLTPRVIKVAPACAIMISTYEYGKKFFRKYNDKKNEQTLKR